MFWKLPSFFNKYNANTCVHKTIGQNEKEMKTHVISFPTSFFHSDNYILMDFFTFSLRFNRFEKFKKINLEKGLVHSKR